MAILLAILVAALCLIGCVRLQRKRVPTWMRLPIRALRTTSARVVLVTGATGFIGREYCRRLIERGDRLIVLTREESRARDLFGPHAVSVTSLDQLPNTQQIDAVVNLAGARILDLPWTQRRRAVLMNSRVTVTNQLVDLIARLDTKPAVLVSMSAIGYYGVRDDEEVTEADRGRPIFQSHLCQVWELAAQRAERFGVRVCRLRSGLVLGTQDGALPKLALSARMHVAVVLGAGRQWLSWVHLNDLLRLIERCVDDETWSGAFNATAPTPVRQEAFAKTLAARFGRALTLRVPDRMLRLMLGEMAQLLADGQRVIPLKATCNNFQFSYPTLDAALESLFASRPTYSTPTQVFYDPACPVCDMEMRRYCADASNSGLNWSFADVAASPEVMEECGLDSDNARRRMYLIDRDGRIHSGIDALTRIWAALPRWRWAAVLISLPAVKLVANLIYDLVLAPTIWRWSTHRRARGLTGIALSHS